MMIMHCTFERRAALAYGSVHVLRRGCSAMQVCRSASKHADLSMCRSTASVCMA